VPLHVHKYFSTGIEQQLQQYKYENKNMLLQTLLSSKKEEDKSYQRSCYIQVRRYGVNESDQLKI
jgi:hypothetical protein